MTVVFRRARLVDGRRREVRVEGDRIVRVGQEVEARPGDQVVDCADGALLPGLHDHHIHLLAFAAARDSVDCSSSLEGLRRQPGSDWIRGVGYHESVAGPLDRHQLDAIVADRPVRVQHRSGALWILNSAGLTRVQNVLDGSADVERDADGAPTGRLWRYDARLRSALPDAAPDLAGAVRELHSYGLTGVTDATPALTAEAIEILRRDAASFGELVLLGAPDGHPDAGPRKLHLRDHDLPTYDELLDLVGNSHAAGRPVAVHCVTRESLILTLAALGEAGTLHGDRIEHASVVPPELVDSLADLDLAVVTQPSFIRLRGDSYLRDVAAEDRGCLYPYASLVERGIPVVASSDAPYGDPDPWRSIRDAAERRTGARRGLGLDEPVPAATTLTGYLTPAHAPGRIPRAVVEGAPADLVLLDRPLAAALDDPSSTHVRAVMARGHWVHGTA